MHTCFKTRHLACAFFLSCISLSSHAEIKLLGISGVSSVSDITIKPIKIYAGTSGGEVDGCDPSVASAFSTCNNCPLDGSLTACNTTRIHPNLIFRVEFQSSTATSGVPIMATTVGGVTIAPETLNPTPITSANQVTAADARWSSICSALNPSLGADCISGATSTQANIRVGIDANQNNLLDSGEDFVDLTLHIHRATTDTINDCNTTSETGVCYFSAYPGDEKAYIEDVQGSGGYPNLGSSIRARALRVYISDQGFSQTNPAEALMVHDVALSETDATEIVDKRVRDLENLTLYYLRLAVVDQANNVSAFISDTNISTTCPTACVPGQACVSCPYTVFPDRVVGLLSEDFNCFIASAALDPENLSHHKTWLMTFREFRNKRLLPHKWGQRLVHIYYTWGPYGARFLQDHSWLKPPVRALLWPIHHASQLVLRLGWLTSLILLAVGVIVLSGATWLSLFQLRRQNWPFTSRSPRPKCS